MSVRLWTRSAAFASAVRLLCASALDPLHPHLDQHTPSPSRISSRMTMTMTMTMAIGMALGPMLHGCDYMDGQVAVNSAVADAAVAAVALAGSQLV